MISQAIRDLRFIIAASISLLGLTFWYACARAQVTWNIVGKAPGEPDLVGTVITPDIPLSGVSVASAAMIKF